MCQRGRLSFDKYTTAVQDVLRETESHGGYTSLSVLSLRLCHKSKII